MKLVFLQTPDNQPREVGLRPGQNIAGRDPSNEVHLPSRRVSRKHCAFTVQNGRVFVKDLGSSNGVIVEGQRVQDTELHDGQRVQIGDYLIQVLIQSASSAPELALDPDPSASLGGESNFGGISGAPENSPFGALPDSSTAGDSPFGALPDSSTAGDSPFGALPDSSAAGDSPFGALPNEPPRTQEGFGSGFGAGGPPPHAAPPAPPLGTTPSSDEASAAERLLNRFLATTSRIPWSSRLGALLLACLLLVMLAPGGGILALLNKAETTMERMSASHAIQLARVTARINEPLISEPNTFILDQGTIAALDRVPGVSPGGARLVDAQGTIKLPKDQVGTQLDGIYGLIRKATTSRSVEVNQDGTKLYILAPILYESETSGPARVVGGVYVEYETSEFVNDTGRPSSLALVAFVVIGLIFVLIFFTTWRMTTRPLRHVQEETELTMKGNLPQVTTIGHWPEMEDLVHSINRVMRRAGPSGANSDGQLTTLVEMCPWPIVLTDGQLRVTHANPVSSKILSAPPASCIGQPLPRLVRDVEIAGKMRSLISQLGEKQGKQGTESVVIDGRTRTLSIRVETSAATGAVEFAVVLIT